MAAAARQLRRFTTARCAGSTKREVRKALGFHLDAELADLFQISRAAIAQWPEDAPIPNQRWLELQLRQGDRIAGLNDGTAHHSGADAAEADQSAHRCPADPGVNEAWLTSDTGPKERDGGLVVSSGIGHLAGGPLLAADQDMRISVSTGRVAQLLGYVPAPGRIAQFLHVGHAMTPPVPGWRDAAGRYRCNEGGSGGLLRDFRRRRAAGQTAAPSRQWRGGGLVQPGVPKLDRGQ